MHPIQRIYECTESISLFSDQYVAICPLNRNDVFRIAQRVRPIFFNSGHLIGLGDMCPQIKSIYFFGLFGLQSSLTSRHVCGHVTRATCILRAPVDRP